MTGGRVYRFSKGVCGRAVRPAGPTQEAAGPQTLQRLVPVRTGDKTSPLFFSSLSMCSNVCMSFSHYLTRACSYRWIVAPLLLCYYLYSHYQSRPFVQVKWHPSLTLNPRHVLSISCTHAMTPAYLCEGVSSSLSFTAVRVIPLSLLIFPYSYSRAIFSRIWPCSGGTWKRWVHCWYRLIIIRYAECSILTVLPSSSLVL